MEHLVPPILPVFLLVACVIGLGMGLLMAARVVRPGRPGRVTRMPYESGMDPIHDTRRRFDVRFHLLAIAFLVFDVELLFLYPWAVVAGDGRGMGTSVPIGLDNQRLALEKGRGQRGEGRGEKKPLAVSQSATAEPRVPSPPSTDSHVMFAGAMTFVALLALGYVYDWRKGVFQWR
jgi:NADH-quinone oxidoreductase subunit A